MKRDASAYLEEWGRKKPSLRAPLIVRGARQVGKSWIVRHYGQSFPSYIEINFEKQPSMKSAFQGDVNVSKLLEKLALYTGKPIIRGKTLLFLDEIQECPEAITYLRYFKEEDPELHIVAAGSLLEFVLEKIGMPVGRVEYLYIYPLSFAEFLEVSGRGDLRDKTLNRNNDVVLDKILRDYLQTYWWLGGMPEVVDAWLKTQRVDEAQRIQDRLIISYQDDFPKYARKYQIPYMDKLFSRLPQQFGRRFIFAHVDQDIKAAALKQALLCLERAGIVHLCHYTASQTLPLAAASREKFFKVFFLDIGLAQRQLGFSPKDWMLQPMKAQHMGGLAEQFVAQELVAYQCRSTKTELFYWQREEKNSQAEIDFLIALQGAPVPIEVKSGKTGHLKSLHYYLASHANTVKGGVKISEGGWQKNGQIQHLPFYAIENWLHYSESQ